MRKIEVPRDIPTEFELGDTAADIQSRREEREQRERGRRYRNDRGRRWRERKPGGWKLDSHTHRREWPKSDQETIVHFVKDHKDMSVIIFVFYDLLFKVILLFFMLNHQVVVVLTLAFE